MTAIVHTNGDTRTIPDIIDGSDRLEFDSAKNVYIFCIDCYENTPRGNMSKNITIECPIPPFVEKLEN